MAQLRQRNPTSVSRNRPFSADFGAHTKESSMLFSMLPTAVQSRLSRLSSIRRSVSMYGLANRRKSVPEQSRPSSGRSSTGSRTPDGTYTNALVLSDARTRVANDEVAGYLVESASSDEESTTDLRTKRRDAGMEIAESKSGIGWKFANQGLSLLSLAVDESSTISQNPDFGNASFARQVYIHAVTYLLRALPADLTTEEQMTVRGALPPGVVQPLQLNPQYYSEAPPMRPATPPSLLHRTLASTIIQLFTFFQFILPYLKHLLAAAYQYDREHKISEKVVSQGIETVDSLGRTGLSLTGAIYGMGDGRVGHMIAETTAWVVEGVTGGIHEGVGEGLVIMGAAPRKSTSPTMTPERR